jgi:predicted glycosyltransferase
MKIFIDIGHPAHVHYFKNFIRLMEERRHSFFITARDKEVSFQLLNHYKIAYTSRGKGKKGFFGKLFYILKADIILIRKAMRVKPDLFLSFGSPYAAHAAWFTRKPHIAFDDTDKNPYEHFLYVPFTKTIFTPIVYKRDFGKKHLRFDGFMELCSTHPNYFIPAIKHTERLLNLSPGERFAVLRFVSWEASHDLGMSGMSREEKFELVKQLSLHTRVIISSESELPKQLAPYAYRIHPALMHDLLYRASLLVSESLTMSAEAAFLGTPSICVSVATAGTLDEEVRLKLIELFRTTEGVINRALEIIRDEKYKERFQAFSGKLVQEKVDVTALMTWAIENYPGSIGILKANSRFLDVFKEPDSLSLSSNLRKQTTVLT